ncbi:PKD-like domain-containing protein, partial [Polaribacter sp.]|uniref:PKD-like domain-containing protein n=1 Tax=Polaribacter sp. TaxID=1920175 RepID=UPI0025F258DC
MKISKSNRNSDSKEVFLHKLIFYLFLTLNFIVKADNNHLVSSTYDLSKNLISNSFIGSINPLSIQDETTICSDEQLGVIFDFTNSEGIPYPSFNIVVLEDETDSELIPSSNNRGASFELTSNQTLNDSFTNLTSRTLKVVYYIRPTYSNGIFIEGDEFNLTFFINPEPEVDSQSINSICSEIPLDITLNDSTNGVAISSYNIIDINDDGLESTIGNISIGNGFSKTALTRDSFSNNSSISKNVIYTIVPISAQNCEGDSFTVTVPILPSPKVADQTKTVCRNQPIGIYLGNDTNGPSALRYNITNITSNGLTASAGSPEVKDGVLSDELFNDAWSNPTSDPINVVYSVEPEGQNCIGDSFTVTVTVNPELSVKDQPILVCSEEALGVSFNASNTIPAAAYNIIDFDSGGLTVVFGNPSVSSGLLARDLSDDTFNNPTTEDITAVYTVVPVDAIGCEGTPFTVSVTVKPDNLVPTVNDQIATSSVSSREGINVTLNTGTNLNAPATSYRITVINKPNGLTPGENNSVNNSTISSDGIFNDSYTNTSSSLIDVIYTIVPISTEGCEGDSFTVTVAIRPEPVVADQTLTVCNEQDLGVTLNGSTNGIAIPSYNITSINSNGLTASAGNPAVTDGVLSDELSDDAWSNPSNAPVKVVYTIVPVSSEGVEGGSFTVTITVNPVPVVSVQTETVCSDDTLTLDLNAGILSGGDSFKYIIDQVSIPPGLTRTGPSSYGTGSDALNGDSFTNTTSASVEVVYTVTPYIEIPGDAADCGGDPFTVTVTVNPAPVVADITDTVNSGDVVGVTLGADTDGAPAISNYRITGITTNGLTPGENNSVNNSTISSDGIFNDSYTNTSSSLIDVIYT